MTANVAGDLDAEPFKIVFIRHGHALDVAGRCIGRTDVPLSPAGASAIRLLVTDFRAAWVAEGMKQPRLISSDLRRALASAAIVSHILEAPVEVDPRLREMDFGDWDGRSWTDIESTDSSRLRTWMEDWMVTAPPEGERLDDLVHRVDSWIAEVIKVESTRGRTIVAVSHAGFIRAAMSRLLGRPLAQLFDLPIDPAHATIVGVAPSGRTVIASNVGAEGGP